MQQVKLKRLENPDSEENKLRLEKLKAKRKAKRLKRQQEKKLKSEVDEFMAEKKGENVQSNTNPENSLHPQESLPETSDKLDVSKEPTLDVQPDSTFGQEADPNSADADADAIKACPEETVDVEDVNMGEVDAGLDESKTSHDLTPVSLTPEEKERGKAWLNLDVCESIVKGLLDLGFENPTPIQQACVPAGLLKYKVISFMILIVFILTPLNLVGKIYFP